MEINNPTIWLDKFLLSFLIHELFITSISQDYRENALQSYTMVTSSFDSSSNPNPSSSSTFSLWFKQLVKTSLEHNLCPDRFLVKLNAGLLKNPVDSSCLNEESGVYFSSFLFNAFRNIYLARIISYASLTNGAFKLALEYLQILYFSEVSINNVNINLHMAFSMLTMILT